MRRVGACTAPVEGKPTQSNRRALASKTRFLSKNGQMQSGVTEHKEQGDSCALFPRLFRCTSAPESGAEGFSRSAKRVSAASGQAE